MTYTVLMLAACGLLGIFIHNLIKLNEINRQMDGNINLWKYWRIERFSIILSLCVVVVCLIARNEIKQLHDLGKWLAIGFTAIGYMAQSLVVFFGNKAQKYMDDK
jgi:hypothetical protein